MQKPTLLPGACSPLPPAVVLAAVWCPDFVEYSSSTVIWIYPRIGHDSRLLPLENKLASLTPSLPQPVKCPGGKAYTHTPANSTFDSPVTNLPSILCILIEVLSRAHGGGWGGLNDFSFGTFIGRFRSDGAESMAVKGLMTEDVRLQCARRSSVPGCQSLEQLHPKRNITADIPHRNPEERQPHFASQTK